MDVILACDLGTSSCKLSAVDVSPSAGGFGVIANASRSYPTRHLPDGGAEQDPSDWLKAFAEAVRDLNVSGHLAHLRAICFTGQMSAALAVDSQGQAIHPALIWTDQRATQEVHRAEQAVSADRFYRLTGNAINATYTAPKLAWLKAHRPEVLSATAQFLQPKDWLICQLTGKAAIDHSDASCTGLYDLTAGGWSAELFDAFGLPASIAPCLGEATTRIGGLKDEVARQLGLPPSLPVVLGGGDGPTSALGVGAGPNEAYISIGTSAWLSFLCDRPLIDPRRRVFSFRHVLPGRYAVTGSTQNAGNVLSWLNEFLESADAGIALRNGLERVAPGAAGLTVLPYLHGERTPYWDSRATGAILGLRPHHRKEHVVRAFAESICFQLKLIVDTFKELSVTSSTIRVVGGLSSEPLLMHLLAQVLETPLKRPSGHAQVTALGAAMVGALALGMSRAEMTRLAAKTDHEDIAPEPLCASLRASYGLYCSLYPVLKQLYDRGSSREEADAL
jgi:xylulokinase